MTADEVIAIAQQAGYPHVGLRWNDQELSFLERFAAIVAAKEREACAQPVVAQQPGAAYAALPEPITYQIAVLKACEHGDALVGWRVEPSRQSFDASMRPKRKLYTEGNMHDFADRTHALRAPHGQAPAQAAPVAVAGTSLQHIHDLLYTAQRTTGDAQAQAIAEARIALSDLMTAPEPVLATRAWPKVSGVSRDEGHPRALLVFFSAEPTDDEMRAVHGTLAAAPTTQPAHQQEPSYTSAQLAEMVLSDCGHSSNYTPLLDRVAARIDAHVERCLESKKTPQQEAQKPAATVIKKGAERQWMSERLGALPDGIYNLYLAPQPVWHEPLTREQVKAICVESGYETATLQERADFINGIRHAERHHGIKKGGQHGAE